VWELKEQQYLRASAGSGFRNPSLRELWFDMPLTGFPVTVRGNEDLDAEQIRSFELAYLFERGAVLPRLKASVNAYYNLIDELIVFQLDPIAGEIVPENSNDEEAFGFEAEVDYLVNDTTSVFANYSWGEQRDRDTGEINQMNPRHKANAGVRRSTPDGFSAMLWASYFDETRFSGVTVDEYVIVNGSVSKTFTMGESRGRLFLDAFNLLGNDHREHPDGQSYGMILQAGLGVTW
jgi:outer membrane receptor protein involved in Fe transport